MQMNRVVIAGYVSKTAEVRSLPSGTPVANVRVSESVRYADGSREMLEHTNWHHLCYYGKLADVAVTFKKGDNVYVDGGIEQRQFIARDGSKARTVHEIVVSQCHVIAPLRHGIKATDIGRAEKTLSTNQLARASGLKNDWVAS